MIYLGTKDRNYQVQKEATREIKTQKVKEERTQEINDMEKCDAKKLKGKNKLYAVYHS